MPNAVRAPGKTSRVTDPTVYPVEEKMGEDILQRWIAELLRQLLERWFKQRGTRAFVGADQFIYYRQHAPTERIAPDVYVLPGIAPDTRVTSWKTWDKGAAPSFALEVVSSNWQKDYAEIPSRYAAAGVSELVIFDPEPTRHTDGLTWQLYRRVRNRPLSLVEVSQGDRVRSKALGCFLRAVGKGEALRVRLATGVAGDDLFPTGEEAERAAKEAALTARNIERAAKEAERAAKEAALQRVAELESALRARGVRKRR